MLSAWLVVTFWLTGRMDSGCHRARVSITSTGEQNVSRTGFSTTKPIRIALTITPLSQSIRIGAACCGRELEAGLIFSICGKSSSAITGISRNSPNSLSPGKVTAIYQEPNGVLWVGFLPRALDRLDRKTGATHPLCSRPGNKNALSKGMNVAGIYKDARGYLWLGGWGAGLDRFDERTGQFKHYRHNPDDPNSLISDGVYKIYGDRSGHIWVGQLYGLSRLDPATEKFTNYRPDPRNPTWNGSSVSGIYQDRSGTVWLGTTGGALIRVDDKAETLVTLPARLA